MQKYTNTYNVKEIRRIALKKKKGVENFLKFSNLECLLEAHAV